MYPNQAIIWHTKLLVKIKSFTSFSRVKGRWFFFYSSLGIRLSGGGERELKFIIFFHAMHKKCSQNVLWIISWSKYIKDQVVCALALV